MTMTMTKMKIGDDALMFVMNYFIDDHHDCQNGKKRLYF